MKDEHGEIARVVEQNKHVTTPMKEIASFYEAYCQERKSVGDALKKLADISQNMGVWHLAQQLKQDAWVKMEENLWQRQRKCV